MARRFVRVDLSEVARDFRPVAIEPGVPLLDHSQANARILHKWLGGLVAEPEWEGESVNFYVCDAQGGRLEDAACEPASDADLRGPLKADLENLRQRIARIKPETSTERSVHKTLQREFAKLADDEQRTDHGCYFFRYKDAGGRWRLVWCWGYQRADQQPAAALVCRDPKCSLLFVRRSGQRGKCPACKALQALPTNKRRLSRRHVLVGLLLLLLVALMVSKSLNRPEQVASSSKSPVKSPQKVSVEPQNVELGVGTTVRLKLIGDYGNGVHKDLTDSATWASHPEGIVFSHKGLVEGRTEGTAQIIARYQATPASTPLEAKAEVLVAKHVVPKHDVNTDPSSKPNVEKAAVEKPSPRETAEAKVDKKEKPRETAVAVPKPKTETLLAAPSKAPSPKKTSVPPSPKGKENGVPPKPHPSRPNVAPPKMAIRHSAPVSVVTAVEKTARFQTVRPSISDEFVPEFTVKLEITADHSDRPLEYRVYLTGQSPPETWTSAQAENGLQRAITTSPPIHTGPFSTVYDLTLEARDPADGSIQRSPLRFRLSPEVDVEPPAADNDKP